MVKRTHWHGHGFTRLGLVALFALALHTPHVAQAQGKDWPDKVTARYKITFGGLEIGRVRFESTADAQKYTLSANAKFTALLGAFRWSGKSQSAGMLRADDPQPGEYNFDFKSNSRRGSVEMAFDRAGVTKATVEPTPRQSKSRIPVEDKHLKGVLDPLSAVLALSRSGTGNPCNQKLAIFDGRQRFDLELSPRREERIAETKPSGQPTTGYVCHAKLVPIAGHREKDEDSSSWVSEDDVEVVLRPVPRANLLVPYKVTIPTRLGRAIVTAERVEITTGADQIALVD
jgi:hypothetical protein